MEQILKNLNLKQREAVQTTEGPLLIIAGAGSGKTRALTHRVGYLILKGVDPANILALTFTNKAANEMRERVHKLTRHSPFVGTFHSLGAKILRQEIHLLGREKNFAIYDERDQLAIIKDLLAQKEEAARFSPAAVRAAISTQKNELETAENYGQKAGGFFESIVGSVWLEYETTLKESNAVDFDDLLVLPVAIFETRPPVLEKYQQRFSYILVDEYQDTNKAQYVFLRLLAQKYGNLCVVGDDFQAIYGWRGADFRNILNFENDYPQTKVVLLEENYRSTQNILDAAQTIIEKNVLRTEKRLWTQNGRGEKVAVARVSDEEAEAAFIVGEIERMLGEQKINSLNDAVVLYRTNAQSRVLEEAFITAGLPYKVVGAVRFFDRREIKDLVGYLRLLANPADVLALKRIANVPPRGIGRAGLEEFLAKKQTSAKMEKFLSLIEKLREELSSFSLEEILEKVILTTRYERYIKDGTPEGEERWENVRELVGVTQKFGASPAAETLSAFLEEIALLNPNDEVNFTAGGVNLMTLHAAKGLEFPMVFIAGLEEGLLPHAKSLFDSSALEEERRLIYVGITRAKERVWLTFAKRRALFGQSGANLPSRFLADIPAELIEFKNYDS